jgi:hypothetical protein
MASRFRGGGMEKALAQQLSEKLRRPIARGIQEAAISVMNGLAQAGPAWTGEFSASWRFVPEGQNGGAAGPEGGIYKYSKKDITITTIEKYIRRGVTKFQFINTSEHANIAIDLEPSRFVHISEPVKPIEVTGWRPTAVDGSQMESLRGDLESATFQDGTEGTATAPLDWYITYTHGGSYFADINKGFSIGFIGQF